MVPPQQVGPLMKRKSNQIQLTPHHILTFNALVQAWFLPDEAREANYRETSGGGGKAFYEYGLTWCRNINPN